MSFNVSFTPDSKPESAASNINPSAFTHDECAQASFFFSAEGRNRLYDTLPVMLMSKPVFQKYVQPHTHATLALMTVKNFLTTTFTPFVESLALGTNAFDKVKGSDFFRFWRDVRDTFSPQEFKQCFGISNDPEGVWFKVIIDKLIAAYPDQLIESVQSTSKTNESSHMTFQRLQQVANFAEIYRHALPDLLGKVFESKPVFSTYGGNPKRLATVFYNQLVSLGKPAVSIDDLKPTIFFSLLADILNNFTDEDYELCFGPFESTGLWFKEFIKDILAIPEYQAASQKFNKTQSSVSQQSSYATPVSQVLTSVEMTPLSPQEKAIYNRIFMECQNICNNNGMKMSSPLGLAVLFGMMYEGLDPAQKSVFAEKYTDSVTMSRVFQAFYNDAKKNIRHTQNLQIHVATGGFNLKDAAQLLKGYGYEDIPLGNKGLSERVKQKSGGIVANFDLGDDLVKLLLDVFAFKWEWEVQFNPNKTQKEVFMTNSGSKMVNMMCEESKMKAMIATNPPAGTQIAAFPGKGGVSFVVGLPKDLTQEAMNELKNAMVDPNSMIGFSDLVPVDTKLPKFTVMGGNTLKSLGDFAMLQEKSFGDGFEEVFQVLGLNVDERGGEGFQASGAATRSGTPKFYANRSFVYAVLGPNGDILMVGQYEGE